MDEMAQQSGGSPPPPAAAQRGPRDAAALRGIQDVAEHLGITHRTLRFYEDKGLIEPQRVGNTRIYAKRDVARMQLILRGKRLGFSIKEIKDFLDLYDADPQHVEQNQMLLGQVRRRITLLEHQREAIDKTLAELRVIEGETAAHIAL